MKVTICVLFAFLPLCIRKAERTTSQSQCLPLREVRTVIGNALLLRVCSCRKFRRLKCGVNRKNTIFQAEAFEVVLPRFSCPLRCTSQYRVSRILVCAHHIAVVDVLVHVGYCVPCYACHNSFPRHVNSEKILKSRHRGFSRRAEHSVY